MEHTGIHYESSREPVFHCEKTQQLFTQYALWKQYIYLAIIHRDSLLAARMGKDLNDEWVSRYLKFFFQRSMLQRSTLKEKDLLINCIAFVLRQFLLNDFKVARGQLSGKSDSCFTVATSSNTEATNRQLLLLDLPRLYIFVTTTVRKLI